MSVAPRVWLTTLGCAKNEVDSEKLAARLTDAGYGFAGSPEDADVVMVNTCAFVEAARQESVDAILELSERRTNGARLVVLGCMAQRYRAELASALPEADAVIGLDGYGELVGRLDRMTGWQPRRPRGQDLMDILEDVRRPTPANPYAYVKVAEGCDKPCTFCAIPLLRGPQRSRSLLNIREEVVALAQGGVGEVVLVAQDLAAYGRDIALPGGIVELLRFLTDVDGLRLMRLLYLHPREISAALISEMTENSLVAPYFDLSLQHTAARLLRSMKRPGDGERHLDLIGRIRDADENAALRSSFIVGFPGETEDEVEELAAFLRAARLDWAGFFPFSPEVGTPAADLPGGIADEERAERVRYLAGIQEEVTAERSAAAVGREVDVVVDLVEDGTAVARSYREAPEIDGVILLDQGEPGSWVRARIIASYGSDTVAEVIG